MFNANESLSAIYVHSSGDGTSIGDLKVYVPALMPNISMGVSKITPVSLNKACFANATDCKPSVSSKLSTQNFITAKESFNSYKHPYYRYGSSIRVVVKDADSLECKLAPEELDNSFNYDY